MAGFKSAVAIARAESSSPDRVRDISQAGDSDRTSQLKSEFKAQWLGMVAIRRCLTEVRCLKKNRSISRDASGPAGSV